MQDDPTKTIHLGVVATAELPATVHLRQSMFEASHFGAEKVRGGRNMKALNTHKTQGGNDPT